ncbi:MAG: Maf family protein [Thalassobaculaceae bacterium]
MAGASSWLALPDGVPLVLASASPRRRGLLAQLDVTVDSILPAEIDETPRPGELPRPYAERMAAEKLAQVAGQRPDALILAADTVVAVGRRILPKTETAAAAGACLDLLSGRGHRVLGAIALGLPGGAVRTRLVRTAVGFKRLDAGERAAYLATEEWRGKAGGYAIQGRAAAFVTRLNGSYSNVVGLDLHTVHQLLKGAGAAPSAATW